MTVDEATLTGERRRQRSITVLAPLPDLDWPADLFASAVAGDPEPGDELIRNDQSRVAVYELPDNDGDCRTIIWPYQSAQASTLAGVAP